MGSNNLLTPVARDVSGKLDKANDLSLTKVVSSERWSSKGLDSGTPLSCIHTVCSWRAALFGPTSSQSPLNCLGDAPSTALISSSGRERLWRTKDARAHGSVSSVPSLFRASMRQAVSEMFRLTRPESHHAIVQGPLD